jgi:hypothetical protein
MRLRFLPACLFALLMAAVAWCVAAAETLEFASLRKEQSITLPYRTGSLEEPVLSVYTVGGGAKLDVRLVVWPDGRVALHREDAWSEGRMGTEQIHGLLEKLEAHLLTLDQKPVCRPPVTVDRSETRLAFKAKQGYAFYSLDVGCYYRATRPSGQSDCDREYLEFVTMACHLVEDSVKESEPGLVPVADDLVFEGRNRRVAERMREGTSTGSAFSQFAKDPGAVSGCRVPLLSKDDWPVFAVYTTHGRSIGVHMAAWKDGRIIEGGSEKIGGTPYREGTIDPAAVAELVESATQLAEGLEPCQRVVEPVMKTTIVINGAVKFELESSERSYEQMGHRYGPLGFERSAKKGEVRSREEDPECVKQFRAVWNGIFDDAAALARKARTRDANAPGAMVSPEGRAKFALVAVE